MLDSVVQASMEVDEVCRSLSRRAMPLRRSGFNGSLNELRTGSSRAW